MVESAKSVLGTFKSSPRLLSSFSPFSLSLSLASCLPGQGPKKHPRNWESIRWVSCDIVNQAEHYFSAGVFLFYFIFFNFFFFNFFRLEERRVGKEFYFFLFEVI